MRIRVFFSYFFLSSSALYACQDTIHFFDVGQGHCTLVTRRGTFQEAGVAKPFYPLLIDAGSTSRPSMLKKGISWMTASKKQLTEKISCHIQEVWAQQDVEVDATDHEYGLNVIVTHGDEDHVNLLMGILTNLKAIRQQAIFKLLLGGEASDYKDSKELAAYGPIYSAQLSESSAWFPMATAVHNPFGGIASWIQMATDPSLEAFHRSGCITDILIPQGLKRGRKAKESGHKNSWSIVTRVQLGAGGLSAILTGDAEEKTQEALLNLPAGAGRDLSSDILLFPHHGAQKLHDAFQDRIAPKAVIIGAGPTKKYQHPQGEALLSAMGRASRVIENYATRHGILYYANDSHHAIIQSSFAQGRFALAAQYNPQNPLVRIAWVEAPIYTLWTTGTLIFRTRTGVHNPEFVEAPCGIMGHVRAPLASSPSEIYQRMKVAITEECEDIQNMDTRAACGQFMKEISLMQPYVLAEAAVNDPATPTWRFLREAFMHQMLRTTMSMSPLPRIAQIFSSSPPQGFPDITQWSYAERALFLNAFAQVLDDSGTPFCQYIPAYHRFYQQLREADLPLQEVISEDVKISNFHTLLTSFTQNDFGNVLFQPEYLKVWLTHILELDCPHQQRAAADILSTWNNGIDTIWVSNFQRDAERTTSILSRLHNEEYFRGFAASRLQCISALKDEFRIDSSLHDALRTDLILDILDNIVDTPALLDNPQNVSEILKGCKDIYDSALTIEVPAPGRDEEGDREERAKLVRDARELFEWHRTAPVVCGAASLPVVCSTIKKIYQTKYAQYFLEVVGASGTFAKFWRPLFLEIRSLDVSPLYAISHFMSLLPGSLKLPLPHECVTQFREANVLPRLNGLIEQMASKMEEIRHHFHDNFGDDSVTEWRQSHQIIAEIESVLAQPTIPFSHHLLSNNPQQAPWGGGFIHHVSQVGPAGVSPPSFFPQPHATGFFLHKTRIIRCGANRSSSRSEITPGSPSFLHPAAN